MLDTMRNFLECYECYMQNPEEVYVLLDLLPYHVQYVFVLNLLKLKDKFVVGDPYELHTQCGLIYVEGDRILFRERPDVDEVVLLELPAPWVLE